MGIIGKTHGVTSEMAPHSTPCKIKDHRSMALSVGFAGAFLAGTAAAAFVTGAFGLVGSGGLLAARVGGVAVGPARSDTTSISGCFSCRRFSNSAESGVA